MGVFVDNIEDVMKLCVENTKPTIKQGIGGPFGSAIIKYVPQLDKYQVICVESNSVIGGNDPTAHAEVNAIRSACKKLNTIDLSDYILVTTAEPCPMCLSSIFWSNIKTVYYGCTVQDTDNIGFRDGMIYEWLQNRDFTKLSLIHVKKHECMSLFNIWKNKQDKVQY